MDSQISQNKSFENISPSLRNTGSETIIEDKIFTKNIINESISDYTLMENSNMLASL